MNKKIIIVRHAKAAIAENFGNDFDRPLTSQGKADAEAMGKQLKKNEILPDLIISSPAKRTRQTAKRLAIAIGYNVDEILWVEKLYHCTPEVIENVIEEVTDSVNTLMIVAHNPGMSEFSNMIDPSFRLMHLPTCGTVVVNTDTVSWSDFMNSKRKVILYKYPRQNNDTK